MNGRQSPNFDLPPLPDELPHEFRDALFALNGLSDEELQQVESSWFPAPDYRRFSELRAASDERYLAPNEQTTLDDLW
ncbi:MAG TPA: hypothetical protein VF120_09335 [Ktedonobacterales bacterium]